MWREIRLFDNEESSRFSISKNDRFGIFRDILENQRFFNPILNSVNRENIYGLQ